MGHKTLTEKLDEIQKEDLGVHFDQSLLWNELEAQLNQKKPAFTTRLWVAASITLLMVLLPFALLKDSITQGKVPPMRSQADATPPVQTPLVVPENKHLNPAESMANQPAVPDKKKAQPVESLIKQVAEVVNEPIGVRNVAQVKEEQTEPKGTESTKEEVKKTKRRVFAHEDISIIQASLEKPTIEREKVMAIKAQLQPGSRPSDVLLNKELKFTLYAKQE
jgi:hypothetical protein